MQRMKLTKNPETPERYTYKREKKRKGYIEEGKEDMTKEKIREVEAFKARISVYKSKYGSPLNTKKIKIKNRNRWVEYFHHVLVTDGNDIEQSDLEP